MPPLSTILVRKDTINPFHGENAMLLMQNWAHSSWAQTIFPNTNHPTSLLAHVQYNAYDAVSIRIELLNNGVVVDTGYWSISDSTNNDWTEITIPISQTTSDVTETRILIKGGGVPGPADETSALAVDQLSLGYTLVSVHDELTQKEWSVYPNPTSGEINIQSNSPNLKLHSAALYNLDGQKILESAQSILDIKSLDIPQGVYYLRITTNKGNLTRKVVVEIP